MTAPIASGWSEAPGGPRTHWNAPPFHGARRNQPFADAALIVLVENNVVARAIHGMIALGGRSEEVRKCARPLKAR